MEIEKIKITDIVPAEYNPRQISDEELTKLSNSINEFGLVDPIIINLKNNRIIGGHQRFDVLINEYMLDNDFYAELNILKFGDIGWVFTDTDLRIESEEHEKALNLALNKISGEWDSVKLKDLLNELDMSDFDIELTGFDDLELGFYSDNDDLDFNPFDYDDEEEEDELPEDYVDVEGERTNESYTITIGFESQEEANEFIRFIEAPREMTRNSINISSSEIKWGLSE